MKSGNPMRYSDGQLQVSCNVQLQQDGGAACSEHLR